MYSSLPFSLACPASFLEGTTLAVSQILKCFAHQKYGRDKSFGLFSNTEYAIEGYSHCMNLECEFKSKLQV